MYVHDYINFVGYNYTFHRDIPSHCTNQLTVRLEGSPSNVLRRGQGNDVASLPPSKLGVKWYTASRVINNLRVRIKHAADGLIS